jgi:guanine nucleotide-binding protein G(i) subunit alpha
MELYQKLEAGFTPDKLVIYRANVYANVLKSACTLIGGMQRWNIDPSTASTGHSISKVLRYCCTQLELHEAENGWTPIPSDIADAMHQIWQDTVVQQFIKDHPLNNSTAYFFCHIKRIGTPEYVPTTKDVLHAPSKSKGITETRFEMEGTTIHVVNVNKQIGEKRKWMHCFENVQCIMFCMALSEYDQVMLHFSSPPFFYRYPHQSMLCHAIP